MSCTYFIYSSYNPNNAACNRAMAYLKALSRINYSVTVLYMMPDDLFSRSEDDLPGISIEYCWDRHYIDRRILKNVSYCRYIFSLYKRLHAGDVVYLYGNVDLLRILSKKKGVHIFHERTEHPYVYPPQGRFFKLSINKYISLCRQVDGLFVISTCLRDFFIDQGVDPEKVAIVNSIVDNTRFDGLAKQDCEPYFAYCGNGNNKKDKVDELIRVFARIAVRHEDIKFYIIGPTKQPFQDETNNVQLVQELGLCNRVVFTGMKPASEVPQLLINAKALFLTRPDTLQNRAGFSTKLSEYLASGTPVVAAGVGDIPLYLKDRENAFVYSPGNYEAVEEAMEFILAYPEESQNIGRRGKETALEHFNSLIETKKLIAAFEKTKN
jgi:glycosyltransferase involved in cell wall biosynthesis